MQAAYAPEPARPEVVLVAGFWRRLAAALVDTAIVVPVVWVLALVMGGILGVHLPAARHRGPDFWLDLMLEGQAAFVGATALAVVCASLYMLLFQGMLGHTPGMRLWGLRVIDVHGNRPGIGRAALRVVGALVSVATLWLGFVWIAFDREKRGLHDWLAGTYVIKGIVDPGEQEAVA